MDDYVLGRYNLLWPGTQTVLLDIHLYSYRSINIAIRTTRELYEPEV